MTTNRLHICGAACAALPMTSLQASRSSSLTTLLCPQLEDLLPISAPAWPHLRELTLRELCLTDFPESLAGALVRLTYLNLADNEFSRIPVAVKLLSNLQQLELSRNAPLQLDSTDAATLSALPHLRILKISKTCENAQSSSGWNDSSVVAFFAISRRLPLLRLAVGRLANVAR